MKSGAQGCHGETDRGGPCPKKVVLEPGPGLTGLKTMYCPKHYKEQRRLQKLVKRDKKRYREQEEGEPNA